MTGHQGSARQIAIRKQRSSLGVAGGCLVQSTLYLGPYCQPEVMHEPHQRSGARTRAARSEPSRLRPHSGRWCDVAVLAPGRQELVEILLRHATDLVCDALRECIGDAVAVVHHVDHVNGGRVNPEVGDEKGNRALGHASAPERKNAPGDPGVLVVGDGYRLVRLGDEFVVDAGDRSTLGMHLANHDLIALWSSDEQVDTQSLRTAPHRSAICTSAARQCERLAAAGVRRFHFYTLKIGRAHV